MKIRFYRTYEDDGTDVCPRIRRAPRERLWMEKSSERFAYRCLPLSIANQHGWEVYFSTKVSVLWNGGGAVDDLKVISSHHNFAQSIFGMGILSFHVGHIVRTDPGYDLYITGSPNRFKPGVQPLTGVVETSWSPYTFTMNWKITAVNRIVEFEAGEPVCFFFPVQRNLIEAAEVSTQSLSSDPELAREAIEFSEKRARHIEESTAGTAKSGWQRDYFQGKLPSGSDPGIDGHRTKLRLHRPRESGPEDRDS
jgi:Family of unknown function (DUF6065)